MTITEFILTRVAEDEAEVAEWHMDGRWGLYAPGVMHMDTTGRPIYAPRDRVVRQCEATRRMVDQAFECAATVDGEWGDSHSADEIRNGECSDHGASVADEHLRILAAVWADHADYQTEWAQ